MKRYGILAGLWLAVVMAIPVTAQAATYSQHYFNCKNCHKAGFAVTAMSGNNICLQCHDEFSGDVTLSANPPAVLDGKTDSRRSVGDASNLFGKNPTPGKQTSHIWGVGDTYAPAGAQAPSRTTYAGFYSRYNASINKVTCSRCHNPHGEAEVDEIINATGLPGSDGIPDSPAASRQLLQRDALNGYLPMNAEQVCRACHVPFDKSNTPTDLNGLLTHPLVDDYATFQAANADKYNSPAQIEAITASSKVRLVAKANNGPLGVGCTSCHGVHDVDSNSTTADGPAARAGLAVSDGHLLRSDGPLRTGATRGTVGTGTDQLRSNLCQSCHVRKLHGKAGGTNRIGCLDCHGGHSYNNGTPSHYILADRSPDAVPVRQNRAPNGTAVVDYPAFVAFVAGTPVSTRTTWSDGVKGTATGFCEKCHGDVEDDDNANGVGKDSPQHLTTGWNECTYCHKHDLDTYSFAIDGNAATCGDCHGFPPYRNVAGDRIAWPENDGGYAYTSATHNYAQSPTYKNEATTPHNTHAAGGTAQGSPGDYIFAASTAACDPCHYHKAMEPSHISADVPGSYQDLAWSTLANAGGILSPAYKTNTPNQWTCSAVYCHSNGGRRNATGTKVAGDFVTAMTPAWLNGDATIVGKISPVHQCAFCHGNTAPLMASGQKNNSASHQKHLGTGTMAKTYSCAACHKDTAASATALAAGAQLVKDGGTHVNGTVEVAFKADLSLGINPLGSGTYTGGAAGTCTTYCHSNGKGTYYAADWDVAASGACGTCHGTTGATLSAPHAKHLAITLPSAVTCVDCHGANSATGTHATHVDGAVTVVANTCNACHGWEAGEAVPAWGQPMSNDYCITCHTGSVVGNVKTKLAPNKESAKTRGHNRPTAAGVYPVSSNPPANKLCTDCHLTAIPNHVNGTTGDATGLVAGAATCTTSCHGVGGSAARNGINTHVAKGCVACHDVHGAGTTNIFMIHSSQATQNAKDVSATGKFFGNVTFLAFSGADSYDEDDGAAGAAGEANADDLCATCHSEAAGTAHNNRNNTDSQAPTGHNIGDDCFDCHAPHTDAENAFKAGSGNACNSCHGYPPNTGAHGDGTNKHTRVVTPDRAGEDLSDCAFCHTGAELYTYDLGADQAAGGARGNHGKGDTNQKAVLTAAVGYNTSNFSCATACHLSTAADGAWNDGNGLNCNACHYYAAGATSSTDNSNAAPRDLKGSHNAHFAKAKPCAACHVVPVSTTHISVPLTGTDGQKIQNRATAQQDEAEVPGSVLGTGSDPDPGNPTCAGNGVGLGCHNTKTTPAWATTGITCTNCHVVTGSAAADPKTGLHNITAAGVQKHDSTLPGGGCTACHNSVKPSTHADGIFNDDSAVRTDRFISRAGLVWTDSATPKLGTCFDNGTAGLDGCHSDNGVWKRRWSTDANSTATATGSARCNVCHGQYYNLTGAGGLGWAEGTSHFKTYGGINSTRGETHNSLGGEINVCEDCHVYTTQPAYHRNSQVTMNDDIGDPNDTEVTVGTGVYCAECHGDGNPATNGTYTIAVSIFPLQKVAGSNDPKAECNSCHGMGGGGRYWPVGPNGSGDERNNAGRHEVHMLRLAQSVYGFANVTELLNDLDTKGKQIELCSYCHTDPGHANHWIADGGLPAEVDAMYNLWLPKAVDANAGWTAAGGGNCSNINCHNGKATSSVANFTWYGTGTQNCLLCHNDITTTTAGTTGATHQAHVGAAAAAFGKAMNCASCHGGSVTWSPYAVPASNHINGVFNIGTTGGSSVPFTYSGTYTDVATRTVGSCGTNLCHNNGKNAATPAYTWQTAISGCAACHATSAALGSSHDPHLNAGFTSTFRNSVVGCAECHDAVSVSDMTGKTAHMDGVVDLKAGITYTGTPNSLSVSVANTYGQCSASICHQNGQGANVSSPAWNRAPSSADNCTICHGAPPANGRHAKHLAEPDYVTSCGSCHTGSTATTINTATHFNGTRNTVGTANVVYTAGDGTCTNSCHKVVDGRDWTSGSQPLACIDCHQSGTIAAAKGALPVSGLHNMTANNVTKHDHTLGANGCQECHVTPAGTHLNGAFVADSAGNNDRFLNRAGLVWADGATNAGTCFDNGSNGLDFAAGCHRDNGVWKRLWSTNANVDITVNKDPGQLVCDVCHGQYQALVGGSQGWREGSVHFRSGNSAAENKGASHNRSGGAANACEDCHAYDSSGSHHENGVLNFSGGNGVPGTYTLAMGTTGWYCATCHTAHSSEVATNTDSHTFPDSTAFSSRAYVVGVTQPEGGCSGCHGNSGTGAYWPDGSTGHAANQAGAHPDHVKEIAKKLYSTTTPTVAQKNTTCDYCHPGNTHNADTVLPADVSMTDSDNNGSADQNTGTKMKKLIGGSADNSGFWRATPGTCSNVACHASAPFTPHWYVDTVAPAAITSLATAANAEPGTVKLTWTAPGDDGNLDGTAYRYDVRYSTASITEGNFASAQQAKAPTVSRRGKTETDIVKGLVPGTTYYFAVKTYDEAGNVSPISNVASRAAQVDNVPPVFWGISGVSANDYDYNNEANPSTNSINVTWEAGRDHGHSLTTPLSYLVLWSEYSLRYHFNHNGAMPPTIGTDACFNKSTNPPTLITCGTGGTNEYRIKSAHTTALNYDVKNLPVGTVYNFLVRAKDPAGNIDSNRAELMAMAKSSAFQPIELRTLKTSAVIPTASTGWSGLPLSATSASDAPLGDNMRGTSGTFTLGTTPIVFSPTTTYAVDTNVWGLSYQININSTATSVTTVTYQFGYLTGKAFTAFGATQTTSISRRMPKRLVKFPLGNYKGKVPAGSKPAFVFRASQSVTLTYGTDADKGGILLFNEQEYNNLPTGLGSLAQTPTYSDFIGGNLNRLSWAAASPANSGQSVHYDVFGSIDNGVTWPYTIGRNLTATNVDWDLVGDGITGNQTQVRFKVLAGDGFREGDMLLGGANVNNENHSVAISNAFTVNNTVDTWKPAAITTLHVETRPKQGAVALGWKAVGNDGYNHGTRATQYDIRYSTSSITEGNWEAADRASNEPYPDFTGAIESYELLGLNPDVPYYFAMKVGDATNNWSNLSNVVSTAAGPKCGICHSTPPDEPATAGKHSGHGYTMEDCANCHGNGTGPNPEDKTGAQYFGVDHQDGLLKLGWKTANPTVGTVSGATISYYQNGYLIYQDTNGAGGFVPTPTPGDGIDNGTCFSFAATNASGCHGPATPAWNEDFHLACSDCHGDSSRTLDLYGRKYDATMDNNDVVPDEIKAAPPVDNHGGSTGKYSGAHLKHLNSSFRLAKGDNCKLCHNDNVHADGVVDVAYDLNVVGAGALWTPNATGPGTPGTCGGTSVDNCHGSNVPSWDSAATVACNACHGFNGSNPTHVSDGGQVRACTWCHPAGHPQGTEQSVSSMMVPNNPLVGIAYRSGGIHLLKNINNRGIKDTEAELCWTCHDANGISEWGTNNRAATGSSPYNYGTIFNDVNFGTATSNWLGTGTGAYWRSGTTAFQTIKKGKIQSTHSTKQGGTSTVVYDATNKRYNESLDAVADIRCSNCHDVHNMNKAPNDTTSGSPYLRGSWMGNPYNEDGPPLSGTTYVNVAVGSYGMGAVPRGGTGYRRLGGYFIDQNNVVPGTASQTATAALNDYPTSGWTLESSAGLCVLCHGSDIDNMDQKTGENLWLGNNGHSNSAIGGTFTNSANIFDTGVGTASLSGRPNAVGTTSFSASTQVPDMAYQMQPNTTTTTRGYGYRGTTGTGNSGGYAPTTQTLYAHYAYDWGATVDADTVDQMYHQFSCSKCHNPHASRLPKLLITNCLDVQHNTWTVGKTAQNTYTAGTLTNVDRGWSPAYYASAQNCHRYNDKRTAANKGGWNKVSIWTTANQ
jgi:predicted CxxxxCH...CXXCH cytochrome family protein